MDSRGSAVAICMVLAIVGGGCGGGSADHGATPAPDVYSIAVTAGSAEALPRCSASLSGTVAYVVSPPMLLKMRRRSLAGRRMRHGDRGRRRVLGAGGGRGTRAA